MLGFIRSSFCFVPFEAQGHDRPRTRMKLRLAVVRE
jgi:hypothetical protein